MNSVSNHRRGQECTHRRFVTLGFGILKEVGSANGIKPLLSKFFSFSFGNGILQCIFMHNVYYGTILIPQSEQICSVFYPCGCTGTAESPPCKQNLVHFVLLQLDQTR